MKFFRKIDIIIVLVLILLGIGLWVVYNNVFSKVTAKAEIYYGSELVKTIDLTAGLDECFSVPQDEHVVFRLYEDGSIAFVESDCPDKICIKSGKQKIVGETAACLPNKLIIKIVPKYGRDIDDIDMIIGSMKGFYEFI